MRSMLKSTPVSIRLRPETYRMAVEMARRTSRSLSAVLSELTEEALRTRRYAGIAFAGAPGERRARIEGAGLDVWEIVAVHKACGEDTQRTLQILEHLSPRQVEAALRYSRAYPEEIEALVAENERSPDEWERLYPHLTPLSG
ncbi:MAG: hypothetical protein RDU83_00990 [bacterium]|nr:hypothetical protein [bacterium]